MRLNLLSSTLPMPFGINMTLNSRIRQLHTGLQIRKICRYLASEEWFYILSLDGPTPSHSTFVGIDGGPAGLVNWPHHSELLPDLPCQNLFCPSAINPKLLRISRSIPAVSLSQSHN